MKSLIYTKWNEYIIFLSENIRVVTLYYKKSYD